MDSCSLNIKNGYTDHLKAVWTTNELTVILLGMQNCHKAFLKINNLSRLLQSGNQIWQKDVIARYALSRSDEGLGHIMISKVVPWQFLTYFGSP